MDDVHVVDRKDSPSLLSESEAEVGFLVVETEALIKASDGTKGARTYEHRGADDPCIQAILRATVRCVLLPRPLQMPYKRQHHYRAIERQTTRRRKMLVRGA